MKKAFTLVELLVVVSIIAVLVSLLLPAVQSVRESARRSNCANNLKQISLGCLQYEQTYGFFPCGGWAYGWTGDPDMGFGVNQPGGWIYNILPFIEQNEIRNIGAGQTFEQKKITLQQAATTPIAIFSCSTRRPLVLYRFAPEKQRFNMLTPPQVARGDYAINAGSQNVCEIFYGPSTIAKGLSKSYRWPNVSNHTGISYQRSTVKISQITDGTTKTYLVGERYINPQNYSTGRCYADNAYLLTGYNNDHHRTTNSLPKQDTKGKNFTNRFGSAHKDSFSMSMCDGSVRNIKYDIDLETHRSLGNRKDGKIMDFASL